MKCNGIDTLTLFQVVIHTEDNTIDTNNVIPLYTSQGFLHDTVRMRN
jgi:hypothetical protein